MVVILIQVTPRSAEAVLLTVKQFNPPRFVSHLMEPAVKQITLLGQGPLHVEKEGKFWNPVHRYKQTMTIL